MPNCLRNSRFVLVSLRIPRRFSKISKPFSHCGGGVIVATLAGPARRSVIRTLGLVSALDSPVVLMAQS
jgi:hypothetical protein